jgi:DNA-binding MarR family transcriptional regulator
MSTPAESGPEINRLIHEPARLVILLHLYVVESADYVYLMNQTGLSWGNLSVQLSRLQEAGYVAIQKGYQGRKPHSTVELTPQGRAAFEEYREQMKRMLG